MFWDREVSNGLGTIELLHLKVTFLSGSIIFWKGNTEDQGCQIPLFSNVMGTVLAGLTLQDIH